MLRIYLQRGKLGLWHFRLIEATPQRAQAFIDRYAPSFGTVRTVPPSDAKLVLVIGSGTIQVELCLVKALEVAGWRSIPVIVGPTTTEKAGILAYYSLLSATTVLSWQDYADPLTFHRDASRIVKQARSINEILSFHIGPVRVGGHAVSTARRGLGAGDLDFKSDAVRERLIDCLAQSMASAATAERLIQELQPSLILTDDTAYTPRGQILDTCAHAGIPVIRWYPAHKSNALMLKRYHAGNRDQDINSLSGASWRLMREMDWSKAQSEELQRELCLGYARKDWYNQDGSQFNKRQWDTDTIYNRLGLDRRKKTAIIFPHIAWDASFGRGQDLFASYDDWFIETVRAACANEELQWIIKIHPGHAGKRADSRRCADEEVTLRRRLGQLPKHVSIIPVRSEISTLSLFPIMDYCLTVRGTVGLEAACRGIPVLTGGTGRYDQRGFTIDSATVEQYLQRIAQLPDIPRLSAEQIELAERFAYGLLLRRPLPLSSLMTKQYDRKYSWEALTSPVEMKMQTREDWEQAPDLRAFAEWATQSDDEDFLMPPDMDSTHDDLRDWS